MTAAVPSTPDPSREQLRAEIMKAIGGPLGHEETVSPEAGAFCDLDGRPWPCAPLKVAVDAVMQGFDELVGRAHCMDLASRWISAGGKRISGWLINPEWTDWLMGFPARWTACECSETQ